MPLSPKRRSRSGVKEELRNRKNKSAKDDNLEEDLSGLGTDTDNIETDK